MEDGPFPWSNFLKRKQITKPFGPSQGRQYGPRRMTMHQKVNVFFLIYVQKGKFGEKQNQVGPFSCFLFSSSSLTQEQFHSFIFIITTFLYHGHQSFLNPLYLSHNDGGPTQRGGCVALTREWYHYMQVWKYEILMKVVYVVFGIR